MTQGFASAFETRASDAASGVGGDGRIRPFASNPFYWQYRGEPVFLVGGSDDHNLYQWEEPKLREHLDLLVAAGGNWLRNTMSSRETIEGIEPDKAGNVVQPFRQGNDGRYDLSQWNDEYWRRLARLLSLTAERGIIVQIEVWDLHDNFASRWASNPWNPANNAGYPGGPTRLATAYPQLRYRGDESDTPPHDFFLSVPELNNDRPLLAAQERYVDEFLSHTLPCPHVLYCVTNEIHPQYPPEWGWHWARISGSDLWRRDATPMLRRCTGNPT